MMFTSSSSAAADAAAAAAAAVPLIVHCVVRRIAWICDTLYYLTNVFTDSHTISCTNKIKQIINCNLQRNGGWGKGGKRFAAVCFVSTADVRHVAYVCVALPACVVGRRPAGRGAQFSFVIWSAA